MLLHFSVFINFNDESANIIMSLFMLKADERWSLGKVHLGLRRRRARSMQSRGRDGNLAATERALDMTFTNMPH
jgi:hypothetical protein